MARALLLIGTIQVALGLLFAIVAPTACSSSLFVVSSGLCETTSVAFGLIVGVLGVPQLIAGSALHRSSRAAIAGLGFVVVVCAAVAALILWSGATEPVVTTIGAVAVAAALFYIVLLVRVVRHWPPVPGPGSH